MGWLGTRLLKRSTPEDAGPIVIEEPAPEPPPGPPLVLLVPDAAAVSSFRCFTFPESVPAADFIQSAVPREARPGLYAFWASHQEPEPGPEAGEAMVLIRTAEDSNLVYVVSFVDIASAQSFARFEVKRGLNLGLITIYWAHLIEISESGNGIVLAPSVPPLETGGAGHPAASEAEEPPDLGAPSTEPAITGEDAPGVEDTLARHILPAQEETEPSVDAQPTPAVAGDALTAEADEEPELDLFGGQAAGGGGPRTDDTPGQVAAEPHAPQEVDPPAPVDQVEPGAAERPCLVEDLPTAAAPPEAEVPPAAIEPGVPVEPCDTGEMPEAEAPPEAGPTQPATPVTAFESPAGPVAPEAAIGESLGLDGREDPTDSFRSDEESEPAGIPAMFALQPPTESVIGDEEMVGEAWAVPPARSPAGEEGDGPMNPGDEEDTAAQDLSAEIDKILKTRRWEKREDPFKGFGSPPGRF